MPHVAVVSSWACASGLFISGKQNLVQTHADWVWDFELQGYWLCCV